MAVGGRESVSEEVETGWSDTSNENPKHAVVHIGCHCSGPQLPQSDLQSLGQECS